MTDDRPTSEPAARDPDAGDGARARLVLALGFLLLLVVVLRSAWLADDALITLRYVENFHGGHGLRWNIAERVQGFTHPLWLLLLLAATGITGNLYHTAIWTGVLATLGAAGLLAAAARDRIGIAVGFAAMVSSKAFIDYSTAGMENPLSHLLLGAFALVLLRAAGDGAGGFRPRTVFWLVLLASLGTLTRHDTALLYAPATAWALWNGAPRGRSLLAALAATLPFWAWTAFATAYYGFPLPNTAAAKLGSGIPPQFLAAQGLAYYAFTLVRDPVTLIVAAGGALAALALPGRRESMAPRLMAVGMVLYAWYILRIGGDFMGGRFFTPLLFWGALLMARVPWEARGVAPARASAGVLVALLIVALGLVNPQSPLLAGPDYEESTLVSGIADERGYYYQFTGLLLDDYRRDWPEPQLMATGRRLREQGRVMSIETTVGGVGLAAGPDVYVMDTFGLNDAFLARLPPVIKADWRPGHLFRMPPPGYPQTVATGANQLKDPDLARLWDALAKVTREPLFAPGRWTEIGRLNTGFYDDLRPEPTGMATPFLSIELAQLAGPTREGTTLDAPGVVEFGYAGAEIRLPGPVHGNRMLVAMDGNNVYDVRLYSGRRRVGRAQVFPRPGDGLVVRELILPEKAADRGFDRVVFLPRRVTGRAALARVDVHRAHAGGTLRDVTPYPEGYAP